MTERWTLGGLVFPKMSFIMQMWSSLCADTHGTSVYNSVRKTFIGIWSLHRNLISRTTWTHTVGAPNLEWNGRQPCSGHARSRLKRIGALSVCCRLSMPKYNDKNQVFSLITLKYWSFNLAIFSHHWNRYRTHTQDLSKHVFSSLYSFLPPPPASLSLSLSLSHWHKYTVTDTHWHIHTHARTCTRKRARMQSSEHFFLKIN